MLSSVQCFILLLSVIITAVLATPQHGHSNNLPFYFKDGKPHFKNGKPWCPRDDPDCDIPPPPPPNNCPQPPVCTVTLPGSTAYQTSTAGPALFGRSVYTSTVNSTTTITKTVKTYDATMTVSDTTTQTHYVTCVSSPGTYVPTTQTIKPRKFANHNNRRQRPGENGGGIECPCATVTASPTTMTMIADEVWETVTVSEPTTTADETVAAAVATLAVTTISDDGSGAPHLTLVEGFKFFGGFTVTEDVTMTEDVTTTEQVTSVIDFTATQNVIDTATATATVTSNEIVTTTASATAPDITITTTNTVTDTATKTVDGGTYTKTHVGTVAVAQPTSNGLKWYYWRNNYDYSSTYPNYDPGMYAADNFTQSGYLQNFGYFSAGSKNFYIQGYPSNNGEYDGTYQTLLAHGFLLARQPGNYTFATNLQIGDELYLWHGANAYGSPAFDRSLADFDTYRSGGKSPSAAQNYTFTNLVSGQAVPITLLYVNGKGAGSSQFQIQTPDGQSTQNTTGFFIQRCQNSSFVHPYGDANQGLPQPV